MAVGHPGLNGPVALTESDLEPKLAPIPVLQIKANIAQETLQNSRRIVQVNSVKIQ